MAANDENDTTVRLPPFHALRAFEAAGRHLSFARAADELGVSPAAVSQHIQQMEEFAGQPLFRRLGRRVELTDAGQAALAHVAAAMASLGDAARIMRLPLRGHRVSVSVAPSFAIKWLVPRLERFKELHPDVEIWVSADMGLVDFAVADVDVAIRYGAGGYANAQAQMLLSESVVPICSPMLIEGENGLKKPEDISRFALLHDDSPDRDPSCPTWPMWLMARGLDAEHARKGLRLNQSSLVVEAAMAGKGIGLAKRQLAAADIAAGRLVTPFSDSDTPINFAYWLVWRRGRSLSPGLQAFMNWIRDEAGQADADPGAGI
ncbi:Glycine cleavage system transcriptional activator [Alphaproteobacteria bacterium SO-S41]|nr:Glycine cleavage system transcriptional activator [Alphaproteobacteria bacterium SO-S41]